MIFSWIRSLFRNSAIIHARQEAFDTPRAVVSLMDRFIDGETRYPLEWDDFISWKNKNENIEKVRVSLSQIERLLFSKSSEDRGKYEDVIKIERDKLAVLAGIDLRYKNLTN